MNGYRSTTDKVSTGVHIPGKDMPLKLSLLRWKLGCKAKQESLLSKPTTMSTSQRWVTLWDRQNVLEAGKRELLKGQIPFYRHKWENLSEFVKDIKQKFSRYYNKKHNRKDFFWSERFKSVLLESSSSPETENEMGACKR